MPTTASNLHDLHALHQRAKAIRDRLASGPKTVAARRAALEKRRDDLKTSADALKKTKADAMSRENQAQAIRHRIGDLQAKLNLTKKQAEYEAIRNQMAQDHLVADKLDDEALELLSQAERNEAEQNERKAEITRLQAELDTLAAEVEARAEGDKAKLSELETAIIEAESIIPSEARDQYRRVVKGRGADGMAPVEQGACAGCYLSVTAQMINDLINGDTLVFCRSCGRILYLDEEQSQALRQNGR